MIDQQLANLHKGEYILNKKDTENFLQSVKQFNNKPEGVDKMNTYPTKTEYENALDVVKKYEDRQESLKRLSEHLSFKLQQFKEVKFKVNKKEGKVLFTGFKDGKLFIGESVCSNTDVFNQVIGKVIAVKKALGEDISEVVEQVENKSRIWIDSMGGIHVTLDPVSIQTNNSINMDSTASHVIEKLKKYRQAH